MTDALTPAEAEALLFGRPPHTRAAAPEPELLVALAPLLSDELLYYALLGLGLPPWPRLPARSLLRARVLTAVAARIGDPRPLGHAWHLTLPEIAAFLSPTLQEWALPTPDDRHGDEARARILAGLSAATDDPARAAALLAQAHALTDDAALLEELASPPLPGSQDVSPEAVEAAAAAARALALLTQDERDAILGRVVLAIGEALGGLGAAPERSIAVELQTPPPPAAAPPPPAPSGAAPPPEPEPEPEPPQRMVNTGFAATDRPGKLLSPHRPLRPGRDYWFCVEVGRPLAHSLEQSRLPTEHLPAEARLVVALFAFDGELGLDSNYDVGELQLRATGPVTVSERAETPRGADAELLARRLFFPVTTPPGPGRYRLRCNVYCGGILVQSRLVTAKVSSWPLPSPRALRGELEYTLSQAIDAAQLRGHPRHKLSLMLNGPGDGTHSFRVLASGETERIKTDSTFDGQALTDLITTARETLREVSWEGGGEWRDDKRHAFRYGDRPADLDQLRADLARLAVTGYRIYTLLVDGLRGAETRPGFEELMAAPGYVQLAAQDGRMLVPLSVVYDYAPFDDTARIARYTLCDVFERALRAGGARDDFTCLDGRCPHRGADTVVCPSGFWGYRHFLGHPLSSTLDVPPVIAADGGARVTFGASTEGLDRVDDHARRLRAIVTEFTPARTRHDLVDALRARSPHVVYLYCHGGLDRTQPFLLVGSGDDGPITRAYLYGRVSWSDPRPLVFVNGCHTTAVRPDQAFDLVSAFVQQANAAGVIGTEITVGEALATSFGEAFLRRFASGSESVGEAMRNARLELLLERRNPLGLVYTPFTLAGLRMSAR